MFDSCSRTTHWTKNNNTHWNQKSEIISRSPRRVAKHGKPMLIASPLSPRCPSAVLIKSLAVTVSSWKDCELCLKMRCSCNAGSYGPLWRVWYSSPCCATDATHCICEPCGKSARAEKRARDVAAMSVFVYQNGMNSTRCVEIECTIKPQCNTIFEQKQYGSWNGRSLCFSFSIAKSSEEQLMIVIELRWAASCMSAQSNLKPCMFHRPDARTRRRSCLYLVDQTRHGYRLVLLSLDIPNWLLVLILLSFIK